MSVSFAGHRATSLVFVTFVLAACSDPTAPAADPPGPDTLGDPYPSQLALAQTIPGFGGYFLDAEGRPTIYLRDAATAPQATRALTGVLSPRGLGIADLRILPGRFDYADLDRWYRGLRRAAFQVPGVVLGDVDEARNRIRFRVTTASGGTLLRGALAGSGVPADAVEIVVGPEVRPLMTLRDRVRPLGGGLQVNFFLLPPLLPGPSYLCTLGFNADVAGVRSFLTNSHCTNLEGGTLTPTDYYQASRSGGADAFIGTEVDDPAWTLASDPACPLPFQCRYSDAARVAYAPGMDAPLGALAMLDGLTTSLGDTVHTIAGIFQVVGTRADPVVGEVLDKVGRTTGWTRGTVTATCVDVLAIGTTHMRLCQSMVSALVDGGDSGSPVFGVVGGNSVVLYGLLWGGSVDEANPEFTFSPMSGIERELGMLTTH